MLSISLVNTHMKNIQVMMVQLILGQIMEVTMVLFDKAYKYNYEIIAWIAVSSSTSGSVILY